MFPLPSDLLVRLDPLFLWAQWDLSAPSSLAPLVLLDLSAPWVPLGRLSLPLLVLSVPLVPLVPLVLWARLARLYPPRLGLLVPLVPLVLWDQLCPALLAPWVL